jgi:hypothetical protein
LAHPKLAQTHPDNPQPHPKPDHYDPQDNTKPAHPDPEATADTQPAPQPHNTGDHTRAQANPSNTPPQKNRVLIKNNEPKTNAKPKVSCISTLSNTNETGKTPKHKPLQTAFSQP